MTQLADSILKKVEEEKITPIPAWYFTLVNIGFWAMWAASLLLGGLSVTMIIFMIVHAGWEYQPLVSPSPLRFLALVVPYLWIATLGVMVLLSWFQIRHTRHGYKYSFTWLIAISLLASTVFGMAGYMIGIGRIIDNFGWRYAGPVYERLQPMPLKTLPEEHGILAGVVTQNTDDNYVLIKTFNGDTWTVSIAKLSSDDKEELEYVRRVLFKGYVVEIKDHTFEACELMKPRITGERKGLPERITSCEGQEASPFNN